MQVTTKYVDQHSTVFVPSKVSPFEQQQDGHSRPLDEVGYFEERNQNLDDRIERALFAAIKRGYLMIDYDDSFSRYEKEEMTALFESWQAADRRENWDNFEQPLSQRFSIN